MFDPKSKEDKQKKNKKPPQKITLSLMQIVQINQLLSSLSDYGEIRLIIQHGELRYINKIQSYKIDELIEQNN